MKKFWNQYGLPLTAAAAGLAGMGLYALVEALAFDGRGLLLAGHPANILLWLLTAAVFVCAVTLAAKKKGVQSYADNFPASNGGAAGYFFLTVCLAGTALYREPAMTGLMGALWKGFGILAAFGSLWAGICRRKGKAPSFTAHLAVCCFLALHVITHYRSWSATPLLLEYVYDLLGAVALAIFGYYQMAFDVDLGKRRALLAAGLLAVYLGTVALYGSNYKLLYLGGVVWAATNLCEPQVPQEKPV